MATTSAEATPTVAKISGLTNGKTYAIQNQGSQSMFLGDGDGNNPPEAGFVLRPFSEPLQVSYASATPLYAWTKEVTVKFAIWPVA